MSNISCKYDPEIISRFYDQELEQEEYVRVKEHIYGCRTCREILSDLENVSGRVRDHFSESMLKSQFADTEDNVINEISKKKMTWFGSAAEILMSKKVLVPAAAAVSIMLVFAVFFRTQVPSGPSAIVTSLSGDNSSVIIMETPDTRQTILWFNEPKPKERRKI